MRTIPDPCSNVTANVSRSGAWNSMQGARHESGARRFYGKTADIRAYVYARTEGPCGARWHLAHIASAIPLSCCGPLDAPLLLDVHLPTRSNHPIDPRSTVLNQNTAPDP